MGQDVDAIIISKRHIRRMECYQTSVKLRLLIINLASIPDGQLANSPTAQSLERCAVIKSMRRPTPIFNKTDLTKTNKK